MEALTVDKATAVLRRHLDVDATCRQVDRGPIGNGQETWFLDVRTPDGDRHLVLRRTAEAGPLEWTDRRQEAAAMAAAADQGLPVPRVHWAVGEEDSDLDAPYMVMDRAPGTPVSHAGGDERVALARDLATQLARLHAAAVPDPARRDAATATRDELQRWREHYERHRAAPLPLVDGLLACLETRLPDLGGTDAVLVWGDAGAHNALGADGRVTALLDWELAHAGHPLEDLGAAVWMETEAGVPADVLVDAYAEASGRPVETAALDWFVALTCVTRSLMILVGAAAFVRGRTHATNLAGLGLYLPGRHLLRAAELLGWPAPSPAPDAPDAPPDDVLRPRTDEIDDGVAAFLRDEVLPQVEDRRTRRGLKTSVALLQAAAVRARGEAAVTAQRTAATAALLDDLRAHGLEGDLATVAVTVERDPAHDGLRPRMRRHLVDDLARQKALLTPLTALYER